MTSGLIGLLLLATVWSPLAAQAGTPASLVSHGPRTRAQVALTFDICQVPGHPAGFDRAIIDLLHQRGVAATFFIGGDWLRTHAAEGRELAAVAPFELANHSWSHPDLRLRDAPAIADEIARTESALLLTGRPSSRLFRLPYGYYDAAVLQAVSATGMRIIQWDVVSGDPDPNVTAAAMVKGVLAQVKNGSIIIFHANGRGWHTAEALPAILAGLEERGLEPVTVSALLAP